MVDVGIFYNSVINDVIEGMKETFTQEGLDLDLLEQLRKLWSSKLAETHVTDPEPLVQPTIQYTQRIQPSQFPTVIGQTSMGIPIARLPIQPNTMASVGGIRTLAQIGRPSAPLTTLPMATGGAPTGLVLRSSLSGPISGAPRPIMLAAALNPQTAPGVQPRLANPQAFTSIAIRAPANAPGQPGQATIIGQPMAGMNGVTAIPGQNVQFVQLGQQTLMLPLQLRQSAPGAATILPAPQPQQPQPQLQQQQQNFSRTQVDGAGDGDSDFSDEDVDVLEPYSVETPSLRTGPLSVAPPRLVSVRSTQQQQPPSATPSTLQQPLSSLGGGGPQTVGVLDDEEDEDDDDDDLVAATPGGFAPPTGSSMFTPNPSSVAPTPVPVPATPTTPAADTTISKRPAMSNQGITSKRSRSSPRIASNLVDNFEDYDEIPDDDEDGDEDFGSVATMTPAAHRIEALVGGTGGETHSGISRRKQKAPASSNRAGKQTSGNNAKQSAEHAHIPDLPPPESASGGGKTSSLEKIEQEIPDTSADDAQNGHVDDDEEEDEPLNSGDDVSDEDAEQLFHSENLVVCQYDRVSRCRSKWRFWLHDGIMKIRGRDRLFQKMIVETDWLIAPGTGVPNL